MRLTPGHPRLKTPGLKFWRRKREEEEEEGRNPPGVFYYCRTYYKAVRVGGQESGGHVLWETTTRGLCGLVCPSRTGTREEPGTLTQGAPVGAAWFVLVCKRVLERSRVLRPLNLRETRMMLFIGTRFSNLCT